ncbi:hypothetical protein PE066_14720 [Ramlibacter tataouinensis]|uniref:hypothetical protein n=1 Tax=Ramlibacter tataouinensis TaxID=94132 RepID=UPI0022F4041A|nr:hypothetical protein [Ramlibacter tataouinensis]WBY00710.1 hypothetical protein PE066_14720 [Ramlibacter tataouinensis]
METQNFTEEEYRRLLELTQRQYAFASYLTAPEQPHVILRHDLDTSLQRALALAKIEASLGIRATYFLFPRSLYYNLLHPESKAVVRQILDFGHAIGLHFDVSMEYEPEELAPLLQHEKRLLEIEFGRSVEAVSFHLAGDFQSRLPSEHVVCGMVNAYSEQMRLGYKYLSDSNGVWRFENWEEILDSSKYPRLQILVHPEWWTPQSLTPKQRLQRAIDGYARRMGGWYDEVTRAYGRPNY